MAWSDRAALLHRPAQIDIGGNEIGVENDGALQRLDRDCGSVGSHVQCRTIEMRYKQLGVLRIVGDPNFINLAGQRILSGVRKSDCGVDQV